MKTTICFCVIFCFSIKTYGQIYRIVSTTEIKTTAKVKQGSTTIVEKPYPIELKKGILIYSPQGFKDNTICFSFVDIADEDHVKEQWRSQYIGERRESESSFSDNGFEYSVSTNCFSLNPRIEATNDAELKRNKLVVSQWQLYFQGITIPFKVRFPVKDRYDYGSVETGFNASLAYGPRKTYYRYSEKFYTSGTSTFVNPNTTTFGFAFLGFIGPSLADLSEASTQGGITGTRKRKVPAFSYGTMATYFHNRYHIGVGIGFDWAVFSADGRDMWIYNNKPWLGFALSFDLLK